MTTEFDHTEYMIRRKILSFFGAKFHIYDKDGNLLFFTKQKAFKLKEDIRIYNDETMSQEKLVIKARQVIDFSAAYDVVDPATEEKVGALRRRGFKSILRDSWEILDSQDNPIGMIKEDSMAMAMLRRFLSNLIPQKFHAWIDEKEVVSYKQNFNPFVLRLNVTILPAGKDLLDARLALAAGILLAAIEGRQKS